MRSILFFFFLIAFTKSFSGSSPAAEIHGADIYGARPNRPFLYKIPATGNAPLSFKAVNLPKGLTLNASSGIISGTVADTGIYTTTLIAANDLGADSLKFEIRIGNEISLTPAMGWNSWNVFGLRVTDKDIRNAADVMVSTGLINHGWSYINIDDGWESPERLANGEISSNNKFPDLAALSDYVHSKGLKFGIYSSPGPRTCGGYLGSYQHEEQDIKTYERWGVDYLKYDWCSYTRVSGLKDLFMEKRSKLPYQKMSPFLLNAKRDIVYSICQYGFGHIERWGKEVGGNSWRTTGDIVDTWSSVKKILNKQKKLSSYAAPGHWNDPDMLVLGIVGWNTDSRKCRLSEDEQRLHFSMWSMFASPLLLGCDLTKIDSFTMSLISNDAVIALNQDKLGKQAVLVKQMNKIQVWKKELSDGSMAIAVINLGKKAKTYNLDLHSIAGKNYTTAVDLWTNQKSVIKNNETASLISSHGIYLIKIK